MNEFITEEAYEEAEKMFVKRYIHTNVAYIDITGDRIAADVLCRILYWFEPKENGKMKISVVKNGEYWLAKSKSEWYDELRISRKQVDRALSILEEKGFIEKAIFRFDKTPTIHVRPVYDEINKKLDLWKLDVAMKYEKEKNNENSDTTDKPDTDNARNLTISPKGAFHESTQRGFSITKNTNNKEYSNESREHSNTFSKDNNSYMFSRGKVEETSNVRSDAKIKYVDLYNEIEVYRAFVQTFDYWNLNPEMRAYKAPMFLLTTFANAYKEHRGYKHKKLPIAKLRPYVEKMSEFTPKKFNHETNEYEDVCHTFSILDYDDSEIRQMVDDYFNYPFDDCDYSIHHFMSDSVLASRFWILENRRAEIAV